MSGTFAMTIATLLLAATTAPAQLAPPGSTPTENSAAEFQPFERALLVAANVGSTGV